jgi:TctA family transporter
MKLQITTFILVGAILGFFTDGVMIGVGAAAVVFIAYRLEKFFDKKNEG